MALLQRHQHGKQGIGILAAGTTDKNGIAVLDHVVVADGLAGAAFKEFAEFLQVV